MKNSQRGVFLFKSKLCQPTHPFPISYKVVWREEQNGPVLSE